MSEFTVHTEESAPAASKPIISKVKATFGMLPNLMATLAESPAAIEGYSTLMGIYEKSDFTPTEKQVVLMTNNRLNGCTYCMAAHSAVSKSQGVPTDVVTALRSGSSLDDAKLEALRSFTEKVFETRGNVSESDVDAFLSAGYTKANILEVVLGTALKVLSNYSNKFTQAPVDAPFRRFTWSPDEAVNV
ncbi:carboxymuconolactone decarboxylase family protein [Dapis sp. BLCC M229]|uniref:carboxymuconolactone decarboxylase family protein n=1 Tax=Dapis sp. BLCC M229 TaxID=3400188 RepID=UPI003CEBEB97